MGQLGALLRPRWGYLRIRSLGASRYAPPSLLALSRRLRLLPRIGITATVTTFQQIHRLGGRLQCCTVLSTGNNNVLKSRGNIE